MTIPTKPGFYWLRETNREDAYVVHVWEWKGKLEVLFPGHDQGHSPSEFATDTWSERLECPFAEGEDEPQ